MSHLNQTKTKTKTKTTKKVALFGELLGQESPQSIYTF
jgi:hypothetical protein